MAIRIVRLGGARKPGEGPRFGTVRRPPRGVPRHDFARRNFYDIWLPELAPSAGLLSYATARPLTPERWESFARRYRSEMAKPEARRLLATLAALSAQANFSVGCYCHDESRCHRTLLRELLVEAGGIMREAGAR